MSHPLGWWKKTLLAMSCFWLASLALAAPVRGQTSPYRFEWAKSLSGPLEGESGWDMAMSHDGSVFVVGYHGGIDLDKDGTVDVEAMSCGGPCPRASLDPLLMKISPDGDLLWLRSPDGPGYDTGRAVVADGRGGVYMTGGFSEWLEFESGRRLESNGEGGRFLARYDADGNVLWAVPIGVGLAGGLAVDGAGNVHLATTAQGSVDLDGDGKMDLQTGGDRKPLLASFTPDGELRWARIVETPTASTGARIAIDPDGGIYLGGSYSEGTIDFDGDGRGDLPPAAEEWEPYLARFDADGSFAWARAIRSVMSMFTVTEGGDLIVLGLLAAPYDLDGDGSADADPSEDGSFYMARLTPDGSLSLLRTLRDLLPWHVTTDGERIVVAGRYKKTLDVDGNGETEGVADPDGKNEGAIAIFRANGDLERVFTVVGPGADQVRAATFSADRTTLFATGFVRLTADFDADGVVEGGVRCDAKGDLFVSRYDVSGTP